MRHYIEKQIIIRKILFGRTERDCSIETGYILLHHPPSGSFSLTSLLCSFSLSTLSGHVFLFFVGILLLLLDIFRVRYGAGWGGVVLCWLSLAHPRLGSDPAHSLG